MLSQFHPTRDDMSDLCTAAIQETRSYFTETHGMSDRVVPVPTGELIELESS